MKNLLQHVADFWIGLDPEGAVVVAVSGGPDSVALLHALNSLRQHGLVGALIVAHLNHQLRGADSDGDEAFVAGLCESLSNAASPVEYRGTRIDVAREGGNLESTARRLRYAWLESVARNARACWVATGHTADDQAETVLHRFLRGSGLTGLGGIPRRRPLGPGVEVVRPLLSVRRAQVMRFLTEHGFSSRQDHSNDDRKYTRNRLRHELLPYLAENYNPAIVDVLNRLAQQADELRQTEEAEARSLLTLAELPRGGAMLVFDRKRLAEAARHRVREMFRLVWQREGWPTGEMGFEDWERLTAVALGEATAVDLPQGISAHCREIVVQISRTS